MAKQNVSNAVLLHLDQEIAQWNNSALALFLNSKIREFYNNNGQRIMSIKEKRAKITAYYEKHQHRFGPWSAKFKPGSIPLADLITPITLDDIEPRQFVKSVKLI